MFLHLGATVTVPIDCVVGVFDLDTTTVSKNTRRYLEMAQKNEEIINIAEDIPRSFILCNEGGKSVNYLSQISSQTLLKRMEENRYSDE